MDTLLGKPFYYWADLEAVMKTYMIRTPTELEERLSLISVVYKRDSQPLTNTFQEWNW
jgi:hypothetical protein